MITMKMSIFVFGRANNTIEEYQDEHVQHFPTYNTSAADDFENIVTKT